MKSPANTTKVVSIVIVISLCSLGSHARNNNNFLRRDNDDSPARRQLPAAAAACNSDSSSRHVLQCPPIKFIRADDFEIPNCISKQSDQDFIRYPAFYDNKNSYGGDNSLQIIDLPTGSNCNTALQFTSYANYANMTLAQLDFFTQNTDGATANTPIVVEYDYDTDVCSCTSGCENVLRYTCDKRHATTIDSITMIISICDLLGGQCCGARVVSEETFYFQNHFVAHGKDQSGLETIHGEGIPVNANSYGLTPFRHKCVIPAAAQSKVAAAPSNDICPMSQDLTIGMTITSSTAHGTIFEDFNKCQNAKKSNAPGLWFRVQAPVEDTLLQVRLCGSAYDTQVAVFAGADCDSLRCQSGNDDSNDCGRTSVSTWESTNSDGFYYIYVFGSDDNAGDIQLEIKQKDSWWS